MQVTHELLLKSFKRIWYTYQSRWPRRTNQELRSWANGFFKIEGFAGKRSLLSPPLPSSFHLFALAPFFARPEWETLIPAARIDQFRYIKIQPKTIDLSTRLLGINPTNSVFIPTSLVLRSIVLRWILIDRNWSISFASYGNACYAGYLEEIKLAIIVTWFL